MQGKFPLRVKCGMTAYKKTGAVSCSRVRANPHSAGVRPTVCQQFGSSTVAPYGRRLQSPRISASRYTMPGLQASLTQFPALSDLGPALWVCFKST